MPEFQSFSPEQDLAFFGAAPLLKGEDPTRYNQLLETVLSTVQPADIFERGFVRTIVNLMWEIGRYRRFVADTLKAAEQRGLERVLRRLLDSNASFIVDGLGLTTKSEELSRLYVLKQPAAVDEVDALFSSAGIDWEVVKAEAFSLSLREIETLNRMIAGAEARMNITLREIDRHRNGFGQQLRRAVEQFSNPADALKQDREDLRRAA
jgi:hypothetical protein